MDSVSFKARFVDNAFVQVQRSKDCPLFQEVALLKVNKNSKSDKNALIETCKKWQKKDKLARILMLNLNGTLQTDERDIYIISQQDGDYRKLIPDKILGMAEVSTHDEFCLIDYFQTNPKHSSKNKKRKIKEAGRSLADYITYKAGKRKTYANAIRSAVGFYKACGFKIEQDNDLIPLMVYDPNNN